MSSWDTLAAPILCVLAATQKRLDTGGDGESRLVEGDEKRVRVG